MVGVLVAGAAVAGLVPGWWTLAASLAVAAAATWSSFNWRSTAALLLVAIGLLMAWVAGTLVLVL